MTEVALVPQDDFEIFAPDDGMVIFTKTDAEYTVELVVGIQGPQGEPGAPGASAGVPPYREVTASGDIDVDPEDSVIGVNKTVGAATNVNMGPAADRLGAAVIIKDIKGDAATNNITPVFDGGELCDGLTGTQIRIRTPYGVLRLYPRAGGWYML